MNTRTCVALSLALGAPALDLLAQPPVNAVEGWATDSSGAALPGVQVTARMARVPESGQATTNATGFYRVGQLAIGVYEVKAELAGFKTWTKSVELRLGPPERVDITMNPGEVTEAITVLENELLVATSQTEVASVVGQQQLGSIPTIGRNFLQLVNLIPGVYTAATLQGAPVSSDVSINGQRARSNNFVLDGVDNNDAVVGSVGAPLSQEAIQEFQVVTNAYSAQFGKATGGVVNVVTKRGSNALEGTTSWYFRDDRLKAKDHFEKFDVFGDRIDRDKAPLKQHQLVATIGGPIWKDRVFFFLSAEHLALQANNFVTISDEDAAVLTAAGFPVQPGANPFDLKRTLLFGRLDYRWNEMHRFTFRTNYSDTLNQNSEPFGGLVARSRGAEQDRKDWAFSLVHTYVPYPLSRKWVNDLRVQRARQDQKVISLDPSCGGPCQRNDQGGPTLEVVGVASVGRQRFTPHPRVSDRIEIAETVTFSHGGHEVKAGLDLNEINNREEALPLHFGGRYLFAPLPAIPGLLPTPISAIQAVGLGLPAAYIQGYGQDAISYDYRDLSVFVQDDWRVSPKLTIRPGVRYQKQFWPEVAYDVSNVSSTRLQYTFPQNSNNFAPRIGFAFDPKGDSKTSLHAAYGIFFDNHITAIAGITDAIDGSPNRVRTLVARLPSPLVLAAWRAPGHRLTEAQALALLGGSYPSLVISIDPGLQTPKAHHVAAGFERQLGNDFVFSSNFIYVRGKHQLGTIDYNPVLPSLLGPGRRPNDVEGRAGTSASVLQYTSFGETWYKGLTVSLRKRLSSHYEFFASYTLGKAEDSSTDFQTQFLPQDNGTGRNPQDETGLPLGFNPGLERGLATQHRRYQLVLWGRCQLPWQVHLSTTVTAASGRRFTPIAGADLNGDGDGDALPGTDRPRRNPAQITASVGRNSETLPEQISVDVRLSKEIWLGGRWGLELIVEAFNLFDRANYVDVNNVFGGGTFPDQPQRDAHGRVTYGTFTVALPPRQIQLAVKLNFF